MELERPSAEDGELVPAEPSPGRRQLNERLAKDVATEAASVGLGMVPIVGPALVGIANVKAKRELDRRLAMLDETVASLREDVEQLAERLADDDQLAELFLRGWGLAGEARTHEKIRILAHVVAAAVRGERVSVSTGHVVMGVLESLEALHLQTLVDVERESRKEPPPSEDGSPGRRGAKPETLEQASTLHPDVLRIALADLEAKQLIRNAWIGTWGWMEGRVAYILTSLGEEVRQLMLDVAETPPPAAEV